MYIVKQGDNQALTFFHCWFMFRKVPQWSNQSNGGEGHPSASTFDN